MPLSAAQLVQKMLGILNNDETHLAWLDRYIHGNHDDPYMPANADDEYRLLARKAVTNFLPLLVRSPGQALYVDSFRRGAGMAPERGNSFEWQHWQRSGLDSKQNAIHNGALGLGHSFVLTKRDPKRGVISKGLSAMKTVALFEDPANDVDPYAVLHVVDMPTSDKVGSALMWDDTYEYEVTFDSVAGDAKVTVKKGIKHGASECPVTRFAACVDLEGRTVGLVEPLIPLQDRINQTVFDLLVAQTYSSFKVRWVTGMAPPLERDPETGDIVLDEKTGNAKPLPINHNARRFLFAEDQGAKFGTLDETPLGGYIDAIAAALQQFSALGQIPPHHLLGQIANLSAEALLAAETSLQRLIEQIRKSFGESWERVFRIAAELEGEPVAEDYEGEVIWRDMEQRSLAQAADALGKLHQLLQIPAKGLWRRVPGVTQNEIEEWNDLAAEADAIGTLAGAVSRATTFTNLPDAPPEVAPGPSPQPDPLT